jgi:hypothetical protein
MLWFMTSPVKSNVNEKASYNKFSLNFNIIYPAHS